LRPQPDLDRRTIDDHRAAARSLQRYLGRASLAAALPSSYTTIGDTTQAHAIICRE